MAQNESLDQQTTEKTMLVQDKQAQVKIQETKDTTTEETSAQGFPTSAAAVAAKVHAATRSSRTRRRSTWMLAATVALVGGVTLVAVSQSEQDSADPGRVSDGSSEVAEANRMETLRNLTTPTPDNSFDIAEANRMETLRNLTTSTPDNSFDIAEANRMETLRHLTTG